MSPISSYVLQAKLASMIVAVLPGQKDIDKESKLRKTRQNLVLKKSNIENAENQREEFCQNMLKDFNDTRRIPNKGVFRNCFEKWFRREDKYNKVIKKARVQIDKEMDL